MRECMVNSDEKLLVWYFLPVRLGIAVLGGVLYFLALPPWNFSILILLPLGILTGVLRHLSRAERFFAGWLFGLGWAFPAFWFLREIHPAVPFGIAPVLALWPAVWALLAGGLAETLLFPAEVRLEGERAQDEYCPGFLRKTLVAVTLAALWTLLEYSRSTMLPWNNLSAAVWRFPALLALAAFTGMWGISFALSYLSVSGVLAWRFRKRDRKMFSFWLGAVLPAALMFGAAAFARRNAVQEADGPVFRIAAIQGDISQRRNADASGAAEALNVYLELSLQAVKLVPSPDLIVWPETAVPYAFRGNSMVSALYRSELSGIVRESGIPVLFGTIEFRENLSGEGVRYGITNSALLLTPVGIAGRYDKIHRVPFGEYIPFRRLLPQWLIERIDMNRDLTPGTDFAPLEVRPGVRLGVSVCFESVFAYVARESVRRGANALLVISNDAWYPVSSEPEQHLANAVARSAETGLYSVRSGNNGGSLLIRPDGRLTQILAVPGRGKPELRRGRGIGLMEFPVPAKPEMTFYVRHGEYFVTLCGVAVLLGILAAAGSEMRFRRTVFQRLKPEETPSATFR